ncbi:hypothetical protein PG994_003474 [Apiospora phragmitis]|uniref:Heterokaryon incompatibility domain-containing protein n=1 Tax=Apiospora phragmitis TaxID=2905665 RepID=A0ABR1VYA3_9PEZI
MAEPYDALPLGSYIRLLELHDPRDTSDDGFLGTFKAVSLDESVPRYTAISYTWDKPATHASTLRISNGQTLPLSQTVTELFRMFHRRHPQNSSCSSADHQQVPEQGRWRRWGRRDSSSSNNNKTNSPFYLWIDTLWIDQTNRTERASQVAQMGRVYSSAEQVLVWLAQDTPESRAAFAFMASKQRLRWPDDWDALLLSGGDGSFMEGLNLMLPLLARPWFRRVWVIQEVALNARVHLAWRRRLGRHRNVPLQRQQEGRGEVKNKNGAEGQEEEEDPGVRGLWNATQVLEIRDRYLRQGPVRYELLLQAAFYFEATDARDAVFAFRGIADAGRMPVLLPLYTVDMGQEPECSDAIADIYRRTAEALLCHGPSLYLLSLGGLGRPRARQLPTWVPDYRHLVYVAPFMSCDAAGWCTGSKPEVQPRLVAPDRLKVQVIPFDTVESVCTPFDSSSVSGQQRAMADFAALGNTLPKDSRTGSWRKDLTRHMTFGLNIDDQPAGPEYGGYFLEWREWLDSSTSDANLEPIRHNKFHRAISPRIDDWVAFGTKQDRFCIGPPEVEVGDLLCGVPGCRMPLLLRPKPGDGDDERHPDSTQYYSLVSWCYVSDMMRIRDS